MIYLGVLLYTIFLFYRYDLKKNRHGFSFHYYTLLIIVCCIVGFSYRLGTDTLAYMSYFDNHVTTDLGYTLGHLSEFKYEPIWVLLNTICKIIWNDFVLVQLTVAIFVNTVIFWFIKKHSPYKYAGLFFYFIIQFWNVNFEIKRESMAIAFFLIAIDNLLKKDLTIRGYLRYCLWCIPALFCHRFAFVILIYPLFSLIRWSKVSISMFLILFFLLVLDFPFINIFINSLNVFSFFNAKELVYGHLSSDIYGQGNTLSLFGIANSVLLPIIMLYTIRDKVDSRFLTFSILYLFFFLLQTKVFIFYRLCNYLFYFIAICYVTFLKYAYEKKRKNSIYLCVIILFLTLQVRGKSSKQSYIRYYPYSSVFTKELNQEREVEYRNLDTFQ